MIQTIVDNFKLYFPMGWEHVFSWNALDHHLYLLSLVLLFGFKEFKKIIVLLSAFTIGHFSSMWLTALNWVNIPSYWVEILIPVTILATTGFNWIQYFGKTQANAYRYPMSLVFGLIHGLGFSIILKMIESEGENYYFSFLNFNLGVEFGQIAFVFGVLSLSFVLQTGLNFPKKYWVVGSSIFLLFMSVIMIYERILSVY